MQTDASDDWLESALQARGQQFESAWSHLSIAESDVVDSQINRGSRPNAPSSALICSSLGRWVKRSAASITFGKM
jgi:hypothetical protein